MSTAGLSRRSLLAGAVATPLGLSGLARATWSAATPPGVMGVSAANDLGPVDPVSREPLPGRRWPLPGWAAMAASADRKQVLVWEYGTGGDVATVDAASLRQARPFAARVSPKGTALSWPVAHRLMLGLDERAGQRDQYPVEARSPGRHVLRAFPVGEESPSRRVHDLDPRRSALQAGALVQTQHQTMGNWPGERRALR